MRVSDSKVVKARRLYWIEYMAKRWQTRHVLLIGARDDTVSRMLLTRHLAMKTLTVITDWQPREKLRQIGRATQDAARRRMQLAARSYTAFKGRLVEADTLAEGIDIVTAEGVQYDLVLLLDGVQPHNLAEVGALAVPLVGNGGHLAGGDHRDPAVRGILDSAVGQGRWTAHSSREGLWSVPINRKGEPDPEPEPEPEIEKLIVELPPEAEGPEDKAGPGDVEAEDGQAEAQVTVHEIAPLDEVRLVEARRRGRRKR